MVRLPRLGGQSGIVRDLPVYPGQVSLQQQQLVVEHAQVVDSLEIAYGWDGRDALASREHVFLRKEQVAGGVGENVEVVVAADVGEAAQLDGEDIGEVSVVGPRLEHEFIEACAPGVGDLIQPPLALGLATGGCRGCGLGSMAL